MLRLERQHTVEQIRLDRLDRAEVAAPDEAVRQQFAGLAPDERPLVDALAV